MLILPNQKYRFEVGDKRCSLTPFYRGKNNWKIRLLIEGIPNGQLFSYQTCCTSVLGIDRDELTADLARKIIAIQDNRHSHRNFCQDAGVDMGKSDNTLWRIYMEYYEIIGRLDDLGITNTFISAMRGTVNV